MIHLYYRGFLKSCNYGCSYCPFSKRKETKAGLLKDREALKHFVLRVIQKEEISSVLLTPYGEALIHEYYWEALGRLTSAASILAAGCQTNLSFPVEKMLSVLKKHNGDKKKLRIWATFHPEMTTADQFSEQCRRLKENGILFSAGAVGDPENLEILKELRASIPEDIYLWINRLDGMKRNYTKEEIEAFQNLDGNFSLELLRVISREASCMGGKGAFFIDGNGHSYGCNISKKGLGSFYEDLTGNQASFVCTSKSCRCFLAYSNRMDMERLAFFDVHPSFRIPILDNWREKNNRKIKALFFDIDGTLLDEKDKLKEGMETRLKRLSEEYRLYFATLLPYTAAMKKCAFIKKYFTGGTFADGSFNKLSWESKPSVAVFTEAQREEIIKKLHPWIKHWHLKYREYHFKGKVHKITFLPPMGRTSLEDAWEFAIKEKEGCYLWVKSRDSIGVVEKKAGKKKGIIWILQQMGYQEEEAAVIGNDECDVPMLEYFTNSIAVSNASKKAAKAAKYHVFW